VTKPYLLPLIDLVLVGPKRFKYINSRGLLVGISFLLLKELLTSLPLTHNSQRSLSLSDMKDNPHDIVFL